MLSGELKKILIEKLQEIVRRHQEARALVTEAEVDHFMSVREIDSSIRRK